MLTRVCAAPECNSRAIRVRSISRASVNTTPLARADPRGLSVAFTFESETGPAELLPPLRWRKHRDPRSRQTRFLFRNQNEPHVGHAFLINMYQDLLGESSILFRNRNSVDLLSPEPCA